MRIILFVGLLSLMVGVGCSDAKPQIQSERIADSNAIVDQPKESKPDLSIPQLDPKPVVWIDAWTNVEAMTPERLSAEKQQSIANRLKSTREYASAEKFYRRAMSEDPTWAYPYYQLACNFELWDKHEQAVKMLDGAINLGFDDYPTALVDDELGKIRDRPDFQASLLKIRERYIASSASKIGQPFAIRPSGEKPSEGWPLILLLHGYGDSHASYEDEARQWAKLGFVAVAVPGSVPLSAGRFQWSMETTDSTHRDLQAIVKATLFDNTVDRNKVFTLGFSQGALHALLLTAQYSDNYAGVVAISPGGALAERLANPTINPSRPAKCVFIHGAREPFAPIVKIWSDACKTAGWTFESRTHLGGHQFPDGWERIRPGIAKFLLK